MTWYAIVDSVIKPVSLSINVSCSVHRLIIWQVDFLKIKNRSFYPNKTLTENYACTYKNSGNARSGPYLGFFVCGGKLRFRTNISTRNSPTKSNTMLEKKLVSLAGATAPLMPPPPFPAMYGPEDDLWIKKLPLFLFRVGFLTEQLKLTWLDIILKSPPSLTKMRGGSLYLDKYLYTTPQKNYCLTQCVTT